MTVVHLGWSDAGRQETELLARLLSGGRPGPDGCRLRRLQRSAGSLRSTSLWTSGTDARAFLGLLARQLRAAGLAGPAQAACFPVPEVLAAASLAAGRAPGFLPARLCLPDDQPLPTAATTDTGEAASGLPAAWPAVIELPRAAPARTRPAVARTG